VSDVVPVPVRRILDEGTFCHVATSTPNGPHVTPMVFAAVGGRVWVTTSRGSVKARAWQRDPRVAGLVRLQDRAVAFTGTATTYDLLDADSWGRSVARSPSLAIAAVRFTRKNARFFAGYAVDAHRVPLAWTPPGRVFAEVRLDRSAILGSGTVSGAWGEWGDAVAGTERFRASRAGEPPLARVPESVRHRLGSSGDGALALETRAGPIVLPVRWTVDGAGLYALAPEETLALAGADREAPAALQVDLTSWWRASAMMGAMVRGTGEVAVVARLTSGGASAARIAALAGADAVDAAIVRLRARSVVWWQGWSSGTVNVA
jgi:hypothetical protein